jgi:hypothetical protein
MALTPETGSGVTGADSYGSLTDVTDYATEFGVDDSGFKSSASAKKEGYCRMAAVVLDARWRRFYPGIKRTKSQGLMWPRLNAYDVEGWSIPSDEVPVEVVRAWAHLALLAASGTDIAADAETSMAIEEVRGASGAGVKFSAPISQVQFRIVHQILDRILLKSAKWTKAPSDTLADLAPSQLANL